MIGLCVIFVTSGALMHCKLQHFESDYKGSSNGVASLDTIINSVGLPAAI